MPFETEFDAPDSDTLGGRILRAREAYGVNTAQLARRSGVKSATIAAWESDRSEPRANRLTMLAGVLGVSPAWLLHGVGSAPETDVRVDAINIAKGHLETLRRNHEAMGKSIDRLADELARLTRTG